MEQNFGILILEELAKQLTDAGDDLNVRFSSYQTALIKLKSLRLNTRKLELVFDKMNFSFVKDILRDMESDNLELACAAATLLSVQLRTVSTKMDLDTAKEVIHRICCTIARISEKSLCYKLMSCLAAQSFSSHIIEPQLEAMLGVLETAQCHKQFKSDDVELEAMKVISRLLEQVPSAMERLVTRWAHLVYPLVIHEKMAVRNQAMIAFQSGFQAMKKSRVVAKQLLDDLRPNLVKALLYVAENRQESHALTICGKYIELLGPLLHHGSAINCLLPVVEIGFKHLNPDVRILTYDAWKSLIDNFAISSEVISDSKKVKLIMKVFIASNVRTESLALKKFCVWWHFIRSLGSHCAQLFEQVVVPLLTFGLYRLPGTSNVDSKTAITLPKLGSASRSSPPSDQTSEPLFESLVEKSREALMLILAKGCDAGSSDAFADCSLEPLEHDVLGRGVQASKQLPFIIGCVKRCSPLSSHSQNAVGLFTLWNFVTIHLRRVMESSDGVTKQDRQNALEAFIDAFGAATDSELFNAEQMVLLLDQILLLPTKILGSPSYHTGSSAEVMKGCPILCILGLLFRSRTLDKYVASKRFQNTLEQVISTGFHHTNGALSFCQSAIEIMIKCLSNSAVKDDDKNLGVDPIPETPEKQNPEIGFRLESSTTEHLEPNHKSDEGFLLSVWSSLAASLYNHILKTNEVNQGNNFEHDFTCLNIVLLFPLRLVNDNVPEQNVRSVLKMWTSLYITFSRLAAMTACAGPNSACEEFCRQVLQLLEEKRLEERTFDMLCQCAVTIATTADFSGVYGGTSAFGFNSNTPQYKVLIKRKSLGNLHSLTYLVEDLINAACYRIENNKALSEPSLDAVIEILEIMFSKRPPSSFLVSILDTLATPLGILLRLACVSYKDMTLLKIKRLENLWSLLINCIQGSYTGAYDTEALAVFSPLIAATLRHSRRSFRNLTVNMWNATFGSSGKALKYPPDLRAALGRIKDRTSIVLPGWEQDRSSNATTTEQSVDMEYSQMEPVMPSVPLGALKQSPKNLVNNFEMLKSPTSASKLAKNSGSPQVPANKKSSKKKDFSFDDDDSANFVVIAPEPINAKKMILTEHQKEVFQTRSILPVMFNNLDASSMDVCLTQQIDSSTGSSGSLASVPVETETEKENVDGIEQVNDIRKNVTVPDLEMDKELGVISEGLDYDGANMPDEPTGLKSPTGEAELVEAHSVDISSGNGSRGCDIDLANHCDRPKFSIGQFRADDCIEVPAKDGSGCDVDGDDDDNVQLVPLSDNDAGQLKHSDDGYLTQHHISDAGDSQRLSKHHGDDDDDDDDTNDLTSRSDADAGGSSLEKWNAGRLKQLTNCSVSLIRISESWLPNDSPVNQEAPLDGDFTPGKNNLPGSEVHRFPMDCREGISETGSTCAKANNPFSFESMDSDFSALNNAGIAKNPADVILVEDSQVPCHAFDKEQNIAETTEMDSAMCVGDTPDESLAQQVCDSPGALQPSCSPIGMVFSYEPVVPGEVEPKQQCSEAVTLQDMEVDRAQNSDDGKTECIIETQSGAEDLVSIGAGVPSTEAEEQFPMDSDESFNKSFMSDDLQTNEECNLSSTSLNLVISDVESVVDMEGRSAVHDLTCGNDSETERYGILDKNSDDAPKSQVSDSSSQKPGNSSRIELNSDDEDDLPLLARAKTMSLAAKSTSRENTEENTLEPETVVIEPALGSRSRQTTNAEQNCLTAKEEDSQMPEMSSATPAQTIVAEMETGLTKTVENQPLGLEGTSVIHSSDLPLFSQRQPALFSLSEALPLDKIEPEVSVAGEFPSPPSVSNVFTSDDDDLPLTLLMRKNSDVADAAELRKSSNLSDGQTVGKAYHQKQLVTKVRPKRRAAKKMLTLLRDLNLPGSREKRVDKTPGNLKLKGRKNMKLGNRFVQNSADFTDEVGEKGDLHEKKFNIIRSNDDDDDDDDEEDEMSGNLTSEKENVEDQSKKIVQDIENNGEQSCDLGSEDNQNSDPEIMKNAVDVDNGIVSLDNIMKVIASIKDDSNLVDREKLDSVLVDSAKCFGTENVSTSPPCLVSRPASEPLRRQRCMEIPRTPPSASGSHSSSRGFLMMSRAKQLFAAPNSRSKPGQMGVDSPKSLTAASDYGKTRNQEFGSPSMFHLSIPSRIFSPSASPSAGILRKKRLRGEEVSVESPSPPAKHRRVCFSDKVDTVEIPNRYQQRRQVRPLAAECLSPMAKKINRQLQLVSCPLGLDPSDVQKSEHLSAQKMSSSEDCCENEAKDSDSNSMELSGDNAQILMVTQESQLNCTEPIYPELVNCSMPVDHILPKLTTSTWRTGLRQLLLAKNIKTVGQLSSLSEYEVHNLPIVQPKVEKVREALSACARSLEKSGKLSHSDESLNKRNKILPSIMVIQEGNKLMSENTDTASKQLVENDEIAPDTKASDGKEIDLKDDEKSILDNPALSTDSTDHAVSSDSSASVFDSVPIRDGEHICCDLLKEEESDLSDENKQNDDDDVDVTDALDLAENLPDLLKNALDIAEGLPNMLKKALDLAENLPVLLKKALDLVENRLKEVPATNNKLVEHVGQLPKIAQEFDEYVTQLDNACKFLLANEVSKADAGPFLLQAAIIKRHIPQVMESLAKVFEKFDSLPVNTENE